MKIATLAFGESTQTLGLSVVANSVASAHPNAEIKRANHKTAKEADYLLVSLYWWKDVYSYLWWLSQVGIDPAKSRKPVIIIGGQAVANPRPLESYYHYAVVGDGEACIAQILRALEKGDDPRGIPGVYDPRGCTQAIAKDIPTDAYVENRKSKIARIELARGCKSRCAFCQLAFSKPYREQPFEAVEKTLRECPTKSVALFAPNRTSYSRLADVDKLVVELGKHNVGSDTRLDMVRKFKQIDCVRFGVEAFAARTRKQLHKVASRKALVDGLVYVATELKNLHGSPMRSATCYMIGDLPGEGKDDVLEFWDTLAEVDRQIAKRFTLFFSVSSFAPSPHTPMWGCAIRPYADFSYLPKSMPGQAGVVGVDEREKFENIVIASRGGMAPIPARLCQMLTIRGDESCSPVLYWLATKGQSVYKASGRQAARAGKKIEAALASVGFDPTNLYREWGQDEQPPWAMIEPTVTWTQRWPAR